MENQSSLQTALEAYKIANEQSESLALQIKELQERKKEFEAAMLETQKAVLNFMAEQEEKSAILHGFAISVRKTKSVQVNDLEALPANFVRIKTEPDKVAIKKALDAGETVQGAEIVENESLSIKY